MALKTLEMSFSVAQHRVEIPIPCAEAEREPLYILILSVF